MKSIRLDVPNKDADKVYLWLLDHLDKRPPKVKGCVKVCYEQEAW